MKRLNTSTHFFLLLFFTPMLLLAQQSFTQLEGTVKSKENKDIITGAIITLSGTNVSTITNAEGDFILKIPKTPSTDLIIKAIGFEDMTHSVKNPSENIKIEMTSSRVGLSEVEVVSYKRARDLVNKVFAKKRENYSNKKIKMTAFYRETIKNRRRNAALSEAIVSIEKEPYTNSKDDKVGLLRLRKDTNYNRLDTIALKLQGGPFSTLYVDLIKYPEYVFTPEAMEAYSFKFNKRTELNGSNIIVVSFEPKPNIVGPLYEGELYISPDDLALQKADFSLDLTNKEAVNKMFVKRKPGDVKVAPKDISYTVDYREKDGKWLYGYSKATLSFEVKKKRKLFKSIFTLSCEMAITDWSISPDEGTVIKDGIIRPSIIMADQNVGFGDPDFWGEYNVIEPEKSIETAIRKIQRKLDKKKETPSSSLGGK